MDWRYRDYYLVTTDTYVYDMRNKYYKIAAPSLKRHSPYNHLPSGVCGENDKFDYDGKHFSITNMKYVQEMLSCKKEESDALEYELRKGVRNDSHTKFVKLSKEMCCQ